LFLEPVPHSSDGLDCLTRLAELFSETHDLYIDGSFRNRVIVSFYAAYYVIPAEYSTGATREKMENPEFSGGEPHGLAMQKNLMTVGVNDQIVQVNYQVFVKVLRFFPAENHS
jgi:hypothetical protein